MPPHKLCFSENTINLNSANMPISKILFFSNRRFIFIDRAFITFRDLCLYYIKFRLKITHMFLHRNFEGKIINMR